MVKKNIIIFLLLIFSIVGCVPENTVAKEIFLPTATITNPPSTPTLIKPTATLYLTPFPTLSWFQAFEKLYKSEFECNTPCWWGITPGISNWTETEHFINQFHTSMYKFDSNIKNNKITKTISSDIYNWYVINPVLNTDYYASVDFEVQNNIVTGIKVSPELVWYFYPIDKLLEEYGEPNNVLVEINKTSSVTHNFADVYVLYEEEHILVDYSFSRLKANDSLNLCLLDYYFENSISEEQMILWAPNTELNFDFTTLKPLEKISEISIGAFYEKFEEGNKCFEISKEAWN